MTGTRAISARLLPLASAGVLLAAALLWSYWPTLADICHRWNVDPSYSHGYLVPAFALWLLWLRRGSLHAGKPSVWGLGLIALALGLRLAGTYYHFGWFDQLSLLPALGGVVLLLGGWGTFRWAAPALAFLVFMIPLPHSVAQSLSGPMQNFATQASTFLLQVLGQPALAEGNVILLDDLELGIVEACSGLRMLVVFFALSTGMALLIRKPLWERTLVALSAVPIALASNVVRITGTALVYEHLGREMGEAVFHDLAGWLMMPLGLAFLGLEMWLLNRLLLEPPPSAPKLVVEVAQQRVAVDPLALYRQQSSPRRSRTDAPVSTPTPGQ